MESRNLLNSSTDGEVTNVLRTKLFSFPGGSGGFVTGSLASAGFSASASKNSLV